MKTSIIELLLNQLKDCESSEDFEKLSSELRQLFLQSWSETPDNKETSEYINLGKVKNPYTNSEESGLILKSQNVLLSDLIYHAFGDSEIPKEVQMQFPNLTQEEWNQTLRICQFALSLFEHEKKPKEE